MLHLSHSVTGGAQVVPAPRPGEGVSPRPLLHLVRLGIVKQAPWQATRPPAGGVPTLLCQATSGGGAPEASHRRVTGSPSLAVTRPEGGTAWMDGGTEIWGTGL